MRLVEQPNFILHWLRFHIKHDQLLVAHLAVAEGALGLIFDPGCCPQFSAPAAHQHYAKSELRLGAVNVCPHNSRLLSLLKH